MRKKDIFEENKELQSSLFLAQSYQDAWADYGRSLKKERFARWDYVVLTASNEEQAEGFREQIKLRNDEGQLQKKKRTAEILVKRGSLSFIVVAIVNECHNIQHLKK